jgi:hypothetical protein
MEEYQPMTVLLFSRSRAPSSVSLVKNLDSPGITDAKVFQTAVTENTDPDLFTSGKCPHPIVINFLHVPEMILGKVILDIHKK